MLTFFSLLFFQFQFPLFSGVCREERWVISRMSYFLLVSREFTSIVASTWSLMYQWGRSGLLLYDFFRHRYQCECARDWVRIHSCCAENEWHPVSYHDLRLWQCSADAAFAFPLRMSRSISMAGTLGQHGRTKATSTNQDNDCESVWEWMRECCVSLWDCDCASGLLFTTTMTIITVMMKGKL